MTRINHWVFDNCTGLTSITIPDRVGYIDIHAFYGCTDLMSISVDENNKKYLSDDGILFDKNKTQIILCNAGKTGKYVISDSVEYINEYAFCDCTGLECISVSENNTNYSSDNGVLLNKNKTQIILRPKGRTGKYVIPDSVIHIDDWVFKGCTGLERITIPDSVTFIEYAAFGGCTGLKDVYYTGSESKWQAMRILSDNEPLKNATIHYNSVMPEKVTELSETAKSLTIIAVLAAVLVIGIAVFVMFKKKKSSKNNNV